MVKIAFGYKMGVGKSHAASHILKQLGGGMHLAFADPLYDILFYAQDKCGFQKAKDRKFLQFIGTEWARDYDESVWVNLLIERSNLCNNTHQVLEDVRFPNEFESLKENGWICIKITRTEPEDRSGNGYKRHRSETSLDILSDKRWDYVIRNDGTIDEFEAELESILARILDF